MFDRTLLKRARSARAALAFLVGFSLLAGLLTLAQAWLVSDVIARVFLDGAGLAQTGPALMILLAVISLRAVMTGGSEVAAAHVAVRVKRDLRERLLAHLLALGPAYAHEERSGELTATAVDGVEALDAYFSQYLPQLIVAALVPLSILLVIFPLDWLSALILLLTAPLIPFFMILIGKGVEALTQRQFNLLGRLSAHFLDTLQGLTTLKQLNQSRAQARVIERVSDQYAQVTLGVLRMAFLSALVLEIVATISTAIVAVEVGLRLLYAQMAFQPALFILILAPEFYLPLRMLGQRFHAAASGVSAVRRILEILNSPLPLLTPGQSNATRAMGAVVFHDLHYAYPSRPALRGVSFALRAGQITALVGPSGAGKSTVAHLLLRLAEPERGAITVNGRALREWDADAWRAQIAWAPQRPHLFNDTLAANLRCARPGASDAELIEAARQAHLHDFITSLPHGYETRVGEGGTRLSGGQAQRLALARAFLKDAPLLILDEPTSQLDPELEALLNDSTQRLTRGRTALVIAHRLSTIARADQVVVLSEGRVVEAGAPATLAQGQGLYRRFVATAEAA